MDTGVRQVISNSRRFMRIGNNGHMSRLHGVVEVDPKPGAFRCPDEEWQKPLATNTILQRGRVEPRRPSISQS